MFLVQRATAPYPLRSDEVRQHGANLAFAEQAHEEEHGAYTEDLDALEFETTDDRIEAAVYASSEDFCVEASGAGQTVGDVGHTSPWRPSTDVGAELWRILDAA